MKTKKHKLDLDDFFEEDFRLIAIYSEEEDYRMAYLLNFYLNLHFVKTENIILDKEDHEFNVYEFKDKTHYIDWFLIHNYFLVNTKSELNQGLFEDFSTETTKPVFLLNELKKAKFLLKIEADENDQFYDVLIKNIIQIPQIYTAELVDLQRIKKLDYLLF